MTEKKKAFVLGAGFTKAFVPDAPLMVVFEKKLKALNLKVLMNEAEEDIKHGRVRPAREFLKDFKRRAKKQRWPQNATTL